jgi:hypothetical protein
MPYCFLCDEAITPANKSDEHVFPNAIGGRLTVADFLCARCNSSAGHRWDAEVARQLHQWTIFFGVVGRRNGPPRALRIETSAGEKLLLRGDGSLSLQHPSITETQTDSGSLLQLSVRDEAELKEMLVGVKRRFPKLDVEKTLQSAAKPAPSYPKGMVKLTSNFGGELSGRSVVKSAVAFAKHLGIDLTEFRTAREYLKSSDGFPCFGYYFEDDLIRNRPAGVPLHCVAVSAEPETGVILAYVEYFGIHRIVACLSQTYMGPSFQGAYAIDPTTGTEFHPTVVLPFTLKDLEEIYEYKRIRRDVQEGTFHNVVPPALKRARDASIRAAVEDALAHALANCGAQPGERITETHGREINRLFAERIAPFWLHLRAPPQWPAQESDVG